MNIWNCHVSHFVDKEELDYKTFAYIWNIISKHFGPSHTDFYGIVL